MQNSESLSNHVDGVHWTQVTICHLVHHIFIPTSSMDLIVDSHSILVPRCVTNKRRGQHNSKHTR